MRIESDGAAAPIVSGCASRTKPSRAGPSEGMCERMRQAIARERRAKRLLVGIEYASPGLSAVLVWPYVGSLWGFAAALTAGATYACIRYAVTRGTLSRMMPDESTWPFDPSGLAAALAMLAIGLGMPVETGDLWTAGLTALPALFGAVWPGFFHRIVGDRQTPVQHLLASCSQGCAFCRTNAGLPLATPATSCEGPCGCSTTGRR